MSTTEPPEGDPQKSLELSLRCLSEKLSAQAQGPVRLHIPDTEEVLRSIDPGGAGALKDADQSDSDMEQG